MTKTLKWWHQYNIDDVVIIKYGTLVGKEAKIKELQKGLVYRVAVKGIKEDLYYSEFSIVLRTEEGVKVG